MAKYLVTGIAGFIGSKTAELLLSDGNDVVGVDNLNDYYDPRLKNRRLEGLVGNDRLEFHRIDIEDGSLVAGLFEKHEFDGVLNLAARAGVRYSMENPHVYLATNALGTLNLLDSMKNRGVNKMVLASTSSLYAGQEMPFVEGLAVNTPISPYAASKKAAEMLAHSYHHLYGIDVSVVRYFTVFGPRGRPDMSIYRFIQWIANGHALEVFGNGSQSRDFTFVDDIARGTVAALREVGFEVMNLGGGKNPISLNKVIEWLERMIGKKAERVTKEFHKADIDSTWADISKAERLLGWKPTTGVEKGLEETVDWHLSNADFLSGIRL